MFHEGSWGIESQPIQSTIPWGTYAPNVGTKWRQTSNLSLSQTLRATNSMGACSTVLQILVEENSKDASLDQQNGLMVMCSTNLCKKGLKNRVLNPKTHNGFRLNNLVLERSTKMVADTRKQQVTMRWNLIAVQFILSFDADPLKKWTKA